jgi:hypothetical protein
MEPVEINAGAWYLRALRADALMDDRPALGELGETDPDHVTRTAADWADDVRYSWAVCEPTTGELLAEVTLRPDSGEVSSRTRPGREDAAEAAAAAVRRFAASLQLGP